jgi:hypothetical protein
VMLAAGDPGDWCGLPACFLLKPFFGNGRNRPIFCG